MAEGKRYFWLKLRDDLFSSRRIKKLRRMAGGDTMFIIYLRLQLLAIHSDGVITFTGLESDFASEMALELDEDLDTVRLTLTYLINCGLIVTEDDVHFLMPFAIENTGSETDSTIRSRESRSRKALKCNTTATTCNADATQLQHNCNNIATQLQQDCNTEIEKEIDIEKEKEIERDNTAAPRQNPASDDECSRVVSLFNEMCPSLPRVSTITNKRKMAICNAQGIVMAFVGGWEALFREVEQSDFLTGRSGKWKGCSFDWIVKEENIVKIMEGIYRNKDAPEGQSSASYDLAEFERHAREDHITYEGRNKHEEAKNA